MNRDRIPEYKQQIYRYIRLQGPSLRVFSSLFKKSRDSYGLLSD